MVPGSVGGLDEQVVRAGRRLGIPDDRLVQVSDVAAADQPAGDAVFLQEELNKGGTEQVPGVGKTHGKPLVHHDQFPVSAGAEQFHGFLYIFRCVERLNLLPAGTEVLFRFIGRV